MLKKVFLVGLCLVTVGGTSTCIYAQGLNNSKEKDSISISEEKNPQTYRVSKTGVGEGEKLLIDVPKMSQLGDFPTGCESVSATMLLNFYGYDLSAKDFIDKYLEKRAISEYPDPNSAFVGSPYGNDSYGCFAPCIAKAMNKILKDCKSAKAIKGEKFENIVEKYLKNGIPVLVWTTVNMRETRYRRSWKIGYTDENAEYKKGDKFSWPGGEHCVVLVGYDEKNYFVNDPLKKKDDVLSSYEKELFKNRYKEQGSQIVVIKNIES